MELDEYTEKLIERSKLRKEYLNKKVAEAKKRRNVFADENQIQEPNFAESDESPKRQCIEYADKAEYRKSPEQSSCSDSESENKENECSISPVSYIPFTSATTRGLAALQKNKDMTACGTEEMDTQENSDVRTKVNTFHSSSANTHRSRLAALAAEIRDWEDDCPRYRNSTPRTLSNQLTAIASSASATNTTLQEACTYSSSTYQSDSGTTALEGAKTSKRVSFHPSCTVGDGHLSTIACQVSSRESNSCKTGTEFGAVVNNIAKAERQQKVRIWDQAILSTLESQGFVKSPSKAKLLYEFPKSQKSDQDTKQKNSCKNDSNGITDMNFSQTNAETLDRQEIKHTAVSPGKTSAGSPSKFNNIPKPYVVDKSTEDASSCCGSTDPAELPLSARKALFEKAFFSSAPKQTETVEPNLSVAARAAMFEKASTLPRNAEIPRRVIRDPPKPSAIMQSPVKSSSVPCNNLKLKSPAKAFNSCSENIIAVSPAKQIAPNTETIILSPSKSVGIHTRLVHQQLIENSNNDWRKNEIAAKASDERKTEISALLNHWEKVSTASSEKTSTDIREQIKKSSSSGSEKYETVFEDEESDDSLPDTHNSDPEDESNKSGSEGESCDSSSQEGGESPNLNMSQPRSLTSEAVAVCNEMDDILDEALEDSSAMPPPPPPPAVSSFDSISKSSQGSSSYISCSSSESGSVSSPAHQVYSSDYHTPIRHFSQHTSDTDSDVPLLHTVSFYRRQKQEKRATPARTIVRRQEIPSPPSPEHDNSSKIQEKIDALQEEVLAQQTVISQTSQALNLCHATQEFFGSTEQVEGERLLLIATQKRLACLNEIQRLKSQPGDCKNGNGTLILNDIRLPLKRDFIAMHLDGKGSSCSPHCIEKVSKVINFNLCDPQGDIVHYFLCIVRYGHQVIVTQMLSAEDGLKNGSLCFTNHISLHNLPPDFSVAFEVYALQTKKEVLPHEKKYHIKREHSKMRLNPKGKKSDSRLLSPAISSPGGPNAVRTPSFAVVGYTRFTLQNCDRQICTLEKVPFTSPLEGVLQLRMQLHTEHNITEKGFLTMFEDVSGFGAWHRRWCALNGKDMAFWKYPDDVKRKEPMLIIDLKQCITRDVRLVSRDICARPHTFELVTIRPQAKGDKNTLISRSVNTLTTTKYLLSADTKEERILWCRRLNDALTNVRKWDPKALRPIDSKQDK